MEKQLKWYKRIALELAWGTSLVIGVMPRFVHYYIIQPFVALLLVATRYRRRVILGNLREAFPEKSRGEVRAIMRRNYWILAEVMVDTIALAGAGERHLRKIMRWENGDRLLQRTAGGDWIAIAAHYGCWEYFPLWSFEQPDAVFMSVYHPLRSDIFECYYRRLRRFTPSIEQVPMKSAVRRYMLNRATGRSVVIGLVADQSPNLRIDSHWYEFFGRPTAFHDGAERLALKFNIPIFFTYIERIKAGRYSLRFVELYDGHEAVEPHQITERYARALEQMIRRRPELWMWSHNRWRHTPQSQLSRFGSTTL